MSKGRPRQASEGKQNRKARRIAKHNGTPIDEPAGFQPNPAHSRPAPLSARTEAQGQYISQIMSKDITFGVGPAGTGKTYVAAALAAEALANNDIMSLIITRPMVACDEEFGFLPGEEHEKYAPWIEPIIDVLEERLGKTTVQFYFKSGRIQAKPLMLMRGKTHSQTWVILDEAQNTTPSQMKMFLTRIGEGAKFIIDGDPKQSDLKDKRGIRQQSGLEDALDRVGHLPQIGLVTFTRDDIVRHGLVKEIIDCYEE